MPCSLPLVKQMAPGALSIMAGMSVSALAAGDLPVFTDDAVARGVNYVVVDGAFGGTGQYGCGVALVDLDNDGDDDIVASGAANVPLALFANNGGGVFTDATLTSGFAALSKVSGIVAGDYDGDGDLDLFITRWMQPAVLYRNEGGLRFVNATAQTLLTGISGPGQGCSFGDYDGDGDLDLAVGIRTGSNANFMRNRLYRNNGNGTFTDVAASLGVDDGGATFHCLLQDIDRDGDSDLYVSNDKGIAGVAWNRFYRNQGGIFAEDFGSGACISIDSMGVFAGDIDGNGHIDIFCTNLGSGLNHALMMSQDSLTYQDRAAEAGVDSAASGWAALMFDADNDADDDLIACSMSGAPDYLWINGGVFPFAERSAKCGFGDNLDTYCLAAGDIDRDGDTDLLMQSRTANLRLYLNQSPPQHHSVRLRVVGSGMNRFAVGALVDIESGSQRLLRDVLAGSCFKSQSSMIVTAGLGLREVADRVTVRWPRVNGVREERVLVNVPSTFVVPVYPPSRLGDVAGDGRVDPADVAACAACIGAEFSAACAVFDVDGDCRVLKQDYAAVERRMLDLSRDGVVGGADLAMLLAGWGRPDLDITGDATVDTADIARMFAGW